VLDVTGIHRTMENAKVRSLRMDMKVWTQPLVKVCLLFAMLHHFIWYLLWSCMCCLLAG